MTAQPSAAHKDRAKYFTTTAIISNAGLLARIITNREWHSSRRALVGEKYREKPGISAGSPATATVRRTCPAYARLAA
jgi:hypothetical protein